MSGDGSGAGSGYGDGYGSGYGDGSGSGSGDGYGYGYRYGYGGGVSLGEIESYEVLVLAPFQLVKIGCEMHSTSEWSKQWREIARNNNVEVSHQKATALLRAARRAVGSA